MGLVFFPVSGDEETATDGVSIDQNFIHIGDSNEADASNGADTGGTVLVSTDTGRTWSNTTSSLLESVGTRGGFQGVTFYGDTFFILGGDAFISGQI